MQYVGQFTIAWDNSDARFMSSRLSPRESSLSIRNPCPFPATYSLSHANGGRVSVTVVNRIAQRLMRWSSRGSDVNMLQPCSI